MNPPIKPAPLQLPHRMSLLPLQGTYMLDRIRLKLNQGTDNYYGYNIYKWACFAGLIFNIFETRTACYEFLAPNFSTAFILEQCNKIMTTKSNNKSWQDNAELNYTSSSKWSYTIISNFYRNKLNHFMQITVFPRLHDVKTIHKEGTKAY